MQALKTRKVEISRDFSAFFDSEVFRNFVDAFRAFRVCGQNRTGEMHFLIYLRHRSKSVDRFELSKTKY